MSTSSAEFFREEPFAALGSVLGVAVILILLWAVGTVAQGQVQRAHARDAQMAEQKTLSQQCPRGEFASAAACGATSIVDASRRDTGQAAARVLAGYR